ncbi:hypothetical protein CDD83_3342 [Cordyceps sp. RAO-2017]|nr:hypothetical protein CDD83_3342 [Cordyceps sp. RAO-2017]
MAANGTRAVDADAGRWPRREEEEDEERLFGLSPRPSIDSFRALCSQETDPERYPLAASIEGKVPVYELAPYETTSAEQRAALQDEWYRVLLHGPGVFVARRLFADGELLERVSDVFRDIIRRESASGAGRPGDHFAGAGANDRIWNALGKHGAADPASFVAYYANPYLGLVSSAWLGPGYRMTAQVNSVRPGAPAQVCHRDYHLGFMPAERCARFPRAAQRASRCLTLQGAVAHVDVPPEAGPTRLLPFSQAFGPGYLACRLPEFRDFFGAAHVALPLARGDGLFFNPALFHAAGENRSGHLHRLANLLQVSSAFARPMEAVDTLPLLDSCWDHLRRLYDRDGLSDRLMAFVAAIADGYPFPTNLDRNPPRSDEMAPLSEQDVLLECLASGKDKSAALETMRSYVRSTKAGS